MTLDNKAEEKFKPKNFIRVVTATSLFDGHDVSINIMRRIIQTTGAEVIHLGHNRSVKEIIDCAVQEDAQAIAVTSYQGGHMEFFKYMYELLKQRGCEDIRIFGGGGGVILPEEIVELQEYGVTSIYSPDDGREMGLQGMANDVIKKSDFPRGHYIDVTIDKIKSKDIKSIARLISAVENFPKVFNKNEISKLVREESKNKKIPVIGITGTGGSGKSSIIDEIIRRYLVDSSDKTAAIISVDPSKRKTGGALLGDRIRMNSINDERIYMRSLATRHSNLVLPDCIKDVLDIVKSAGYDLIILETSGIGQSDTEIVDNSDLSIYVMTPEYGASTQLEKIDMIDFADVVVLNKFDRRGAEDALNDVKKQYVRSRKIEDSIENVPVLGTVASQFNNPGMNRFYNVLFHKIKEKTGVDFQTGLLQTDECIEKISIIPLNKMRYLSEISETVRNYNEWVDEQSKTAQELYGIHKTIDIINQSNEEKDNLDLIDKLNKLYKRVKEALYPDNYEIIKNWDRKIADYKKEYFIFKVRDNEIKIKTQTESLSHIKIPKVSFPKYKAWGDLLKWNLKEGIPGEFPFAGGVFPFKREGEDATRMFAGEGGPERTNKRFHYISKGLKAKRLSTAFDSVTLYGQDPDVRPDIYGKIGNAGVSIACLDDLKKLYSGFHLADSKTSVSMTINGPAPIMVSYFMNAAIDQQCEIYIKKQGLEKEVQKDIDSIFEKKDLKRPKYHGRLPEENDGLGLMFLGVTGDQVLPLEIYEKIKTDTLSKVRGTVQADILKEDQAQNTCIYSTEFSLKLMGDVQEYFIKNNVRNFYSVSISGYHIAEAGANPITQLAFTLANGFTYLEYYLSRGMDIDKFAPNLSFFFSNGIDAEFSVIGRVARIIWAKAMKLKYKGHSRSQKLKYHIQTSGRSLHAQEIDFNDIRTTLQALYAIYDNCNSLHTNAYDEAITTPTEESVRRAMAIQLIINHELGLSKNQNPLQGAFIIEELTELVEEAVLIEFDRLSQRGGVLGAMETAYQRGKIQEESLYYEKLKHNGDLPIMGVNTFFSSKGSPTIIPGEIIRATDAEKKYQIEMLEKLHNSNKKNSSGLIKKLQEASLNNENIFNVLMEVGKSCSIGQITEALFEVGGQYRRNM